MSISRQCLNIEGLRVLAVDPIANATQTSQIIEVLRRSCFTSHAPNNAN